MMKFVKAAGAIVLGLCMCKAGVLASAVDMIQEEVQGASEGRVVDWDAEVVKATGKLEGKRGEVPAGRALKSPKSPKSCKASKSSKSFPGKWNAANEEVYEALVDATDVTNVEFTGTSTEVITLDFNLNWFDNTVSKICLFRNGFITIGDSCNNQEFGLIDFVSAGLDPSIGSVKYLQKKPKSSNSSLKISFEDVPFAVGGGYVQAQMELFESGDVLICYGLGDLAGEEILAGIDDNTSTPSNPVVYPIKDPPFDEPYGITSVWPECKCWKFIMP